MALTIEFPDSEYSSLVWQHAARNRLPAPGQVARVLARSLNHIVARRLRQLPGKAVAPTAARDNNSTLRLWMTRYRASMNGTKLVSEVAYLPTDDTTQSPSYRIDIDSATATADDGNNSFTHSRYCAAGSGTTFSDIAYDRRVFTVTAGTKHTVELYTLAAMRVVGWRLYELPRDSITVGTDQVCNYTYLLPQTGIYDASIASLLSIQQQAFDKQRYADMSFCVDDANAIPARLGSGITTAFVNLWDGSAARSTTTVGSRRATQYRNNYADDFAGTDTIPTYAWAYGARTSVGGSITVRFEGGNGTTDITINGAAGIYESTSFTLLPQAAGDKVDVSIMKDAAGTTGYLVACGCFPLVGV